MLRHNLAAVRLPAFTAHDPQIHDRAEIFRRKFKGVPTRSFPRRCSDSPQSVMLRMTMRGAPILFASFAYNGGIDIVNVARLSDAVAYFFREYRQHIVTPGGEYNFSEEQAKADCDYPPLKAILESFKIVLDDVGFLSNEKRLEAKSIRTQESTFNKRFKILEDCVGALDSALKRTEEEMLKLKRELNTAQARIATLEMGEVQKAVIEERKAVVFHQPPQIELPESKPDVVCGKGGVFGTTSEPSPLW